MNGHMRFPRMAPVTCISLSFYWFLVLLMIGFLCICFGFMTLNGEAQVKSKNRSICTSFELLFLFNYPQRSDMSWCENSGR